MRRPHGALWLVLLGACGSPSAVQDSGLLMDAQPADAVLARDGSSSPDASSCPDLDRDGVGGVPCGADCNDADDTVWPGNVETCNRRDEDCDPRTFGPDRDRDLAQPSQCCNPQPSGVEACGTDCDDASPDISPTAPESCNGVDDDCDGEVDEGGTRVFYADADADGAGRDDSTRSGCTVPVGYATVGGDCDDANPSRKPGQAETCNGVDDDCDGVLDAPNEDRDLDGFVGDGCGASVTATDCNDQSNTVNPRATETCNGIDDDCDGLRDDGVVGCSVVYCAASQRVCTASEVCCAGMNRCLAGGSCPMQVVQCDAPADCGPGMRCCEGLAGNTFCASSCPGSSVCERAADCAGQPCDQNPSSVYGTCRGGGCPDRDGDLVQDVACGGRDCDDSMASVNPLALEVCNGRDDNCNGVIDEGVQQTSYRDQDNDGFGDPAMTRMSCTAMLGWAVLGTDCNDSQPSINPAALEICDSGNVDENCDGTRNEGCGCSTGAARMCPLPGRCSAGVQMCGAGMWGACSITPIAEICGNGIDDNCDGRVDERC